MLVQKVEYKSALFFMNPLPALEVRLSGRRHSSACSLKLLHLLQTVKMSKSLFLFSSIRKRVLCHLFPAPTGVSPRTTEHPAP